MPNWSYVYRVQDRKWTDRTACKRDKRELMYQGKDVNIPIV